MLSEGVGASSDRANVWFLLLEFFFLHNATVMSSFNVSILGHHRLSNEKFFNDFFFFASLSFFVNNGTAFHL